MQVAIPSSLEYIYHDHNLTNTQYSIEVYRCSSTESPCGFAYRSCCV